MLNRRNLLAGISAAAVAPVLPTISDPPFTLSALEIVNRALHHAAVEPIAVYGRSPAMVCLPSLRQLQAMIAEAGKTSSAPQAL